MHNKVDRTGEHHGNQNKPGTTRQVLYDLSPKWEINNVNLKVEE
jgi:hypothetical protein